MTIVFGVCAGSAFSFTFDKHIINFLSFAD